MTQEKRLDLHTHSICSDGSETPARVVALAAEAGVSLLALTDHDCMEGTAESLAAGEREGVRVLTGVELDTEYDSELHILGLDVEVENPRLTALLSAARQRRIARNAGIYERLKRTGCDVEACVPRSIGTTTRLHIALALMDAGYASDLRDAFDRYLRPGRPGYFALPRPAPEEAVETILAAGGVPVWAHPFHAKGDLHALFLRLCDAGLAGVEAYHWSATAGEAEVLTSLARQRGLLVTCGSDYHGAHRRNVQVGCAWRDAPALAEAYAYFDGRWEARRAPK